jgi:hypothetical protein
MFLLYSRQNRESLEVIEFIQSHKLQPYIEFVCCDSMSAHKIIGSRTVQVPCLVMMHNNTLMFKTNSELRDALITLYREHNNNPRVPSEILSQKKTTKESGLHFFEPRLEGDGYQLFESPLLEPLSVDDLITEPVDDTTAISGVQNLSLLKDARLKLQEAIKDITNTERERLDDFEDTLRAPEIFALPIYTPNIQLQINQAIKRQANNEISRLDRSEDRFRIPDPDNVTDLKPPSRLNSLIEMKRMANIQRDAIDEFETVIKDDPQRFFC